jgi:hypothetical protein
MSYGPCGRCPSSSLTSFADEATFGRAKLARPAAYLLKAYDAAALQHALELALLNFAAGHTAPLPLALTPAAQPCPAAPRCSSRLNKHSIN